MHWSFRSAVTMAAVLVAALAPTACKRETHESARANGATRLAANEVENLRYIHANTAVGVPHRLNLADPRQYAYVEATLRRFGHTPERAPRLFELLQGARRGTPGRPVAVGTRLVPAPRPGSDFDFLDRVRGVAGTQPAGSQPYRFASARTAPAQAPPAATSDSAVLGGLNYTTDFGRNTDGSYYTNAYSTYPDSQVPYNTRIMVSLVDPSTGSVLSQADSNVYSRTNVKVPVSAAAPADSSSVVSNTLFLVAPQQGEPLEAYTVMLEDRTDVVTPCQLSPNYNTVSGGTTQQCGTNAATQCVNSGSTAKMIKVCYGPRIQSDCDYGCTGSGQPPNVIFPIQGSVDLGAQPDTPFVGTVYIVLKALTGGGCALEATANNTPVDSLITLNGTVASWNLAPASFPTGTPSCVQTNGMTMNYTFQLFLQTATGSAGVTFTSDTSQASSPNTVMVPQLDIIEGCLPEGVRIRMEDGSEKTVESFRGYGNERVRSRNPAARAVTAITGGTEAKPLVSLRTSGGHALLLTETHPVITPRGPVMAMHVKRGDTVLTESGTATLVEVGRRPSPRAVPVHNLRVGSRDEAARGQTTFYANGILVGDQLMQQHLHLQALMPRQRSREEILAGLPREWHRDFLNNQR